MCFNYVLFTACVLQQTTGDTVLHVACRRKDMDLAKLFIDSGATVDQPNVRQCFM